MRYLTAEQILAIHFELVEQTGGAHGVRDVGLLSSIAEKPKTRLFGKEMYRGVFTKAAVYLESLATYHVFVDGNKRTAITSAARFLNLNGYQLIVENQMLENFVLEVATKKVNLAAVADWLKKHSRKRSKI